MREYITALRNFALLKFNYCDGVMYKQFLTITWSQEALDQGSSTFWVRGPIYIFHIILRAAVIADYRIINILNIITGTWAARQVTNVKCLWRRWSNGSCRTSCYVDEATKDWRMRQNLILQPLHLFTYVTVHSPTLPPLYVRHSSFYNPSVPSPTP